MWSRPLRADGLDSHDVRALLPAVRRARLLRASGVGLAVVLLAAAVASARGLDARERGLLPGDATGVVVVDLSLSIAEEDYLEVRKALRQLITEDASVGLVVFSDVPYELLPPGTPASAMRPLLRLLVPAKLGPPVHPWSQTFSAGTRVSAGLELAKAMLERDEVDNGVILLVSDLETAPDDVPHLARTVAEIRRSPIALRVYPLGPSSDARRIFGGLLDEDAFAVPLDPGDAEPVAGESRARAPWALLILGGLLFAALALHERFGGRLALPRLGRAG